MRLGALTFDDLGRDEFALALLCELEPCEHGRCRGIRVCEFCDYNEGRRAAACSTWVEADAGVSVRFVFHGHLEARPYGVVHNL